MMEENRDAITLEMKIKVEWESYWCTLLKETQRLWAEALRDQTSTFNSEKSILRKPRMWVDLVRRLPGNVGDRSSWLYWFLADLLFQSHQRAASSQMHRWARSSQSQWHTVSTHSERETSISQSQQRAASSQNQQRADGSSPCYLLKSNAVIKKWAGRNYWKC